LQSNQSLAIIGNLWKSLAINRQSLAIWAIKNSAFSPLGNKQKEKHRIFLDLVG
jgi:hypothetical protein